MRRGAPTAPGAFLRTGRKPFQTMQRTVACSSLRELKPDMANNQRHTAPAEPKASLTEQQRRLDGFLQAALETERQRRLDDFLIVALDKLNDLDQAAHSAANRPWWRRLTRPRC